MPRNKNIWADVPAGHDNPLNFAVTTRDASIIQMVEQAVQGKQAMLAYQPIVPTGAKTRPALYEGLIRIFDETGRIIPAREFIDAVEAAETGRRIDCLALQKGLKALSANPDLRLAINMSARSIGYAQWIRILRKGLEQDPTVAERLILEITESSAMLVPEIVISFMAEFHKKGVSFALDDFGAGYTSFRRLRDFYFDILKIDGQFVRNIANVPDNQIVVSAIAAIAKQFDMVSIAESVETESDVAFLTDIGVSCLQGYYFGAPTIHPPWGKDANRRNRA